MNFFESQKRAHRNTSFLLFLCFLSVCATIVAVYFAIMGCWVGLMASDEHNMLTHVNLRQFWNLDLFLWISAITAGLVAITSFIKAMELAKGGEVVAVMLGGRRIRPDTTHTDQRKAMNVVEEMAIACGIPVPPVYIIEEDSINAFAAGYSPRDAVIGVTNGCVERLSRTQLQGVIAHEFSHIFNGDMRININLVGVLHGLLAISMAGYILLRGASRSSHRSSNDRKGSGVGAILILGVLLYAIGWIGALFAKMIKAGISRQREFLADASAVQYTRDPSGIAGALKKIAMDAEGSSVSSPNAEEVSHFFFADGLASHFMNIFSTHPPLEERIRRIDPRMLLEGELPGEPVAGPAGDDAVAVSGLSAPLTKAQDVTSSIGNYTSEHLQYAHNLLAGMPLAMRSILRTPSGARAVIYAMLLNTDREAQSKQLEYLGVNADQLEKRDLEKLVPLVTPLGPEFRLPILELSLSVLRDLTREQYSRFRSNVQFMIEADQRCTVFEYALQRILKRHLDQHFSGTRKQAAKLGQDQVSKAGVQLIAALSSLVHPDSEAAQRAFEQGIQALGRRDLRRITVEINAALKNLDDALIVLEGIALEDKKVVLDACVAAVFHDKRVTVEETELLRAVSESLECPIPPFRVDA